MRMWFLLPAVGLSLLDFFCLDSALFPFAAACDILALSSTLLLQPLSFEETAPALVSVRIGSALAVLARLLCVLFCPTLLWPTVAVSEVYLAAFLFARHCAKMRNLRQLFDYVAVWHGVEDKARLFYAFLLAIVSLPALLSSVCAEDIPLWAGTAILSLSGFFAAVLYARAYLARTFFVSRKKEKQIMDIVTGNFRTPPMKWCEDDGMSKLYKRIISYMDADRPFLNPDFCLEDLSRGVMTNKSYVSRTVNIMSGRNISAFINMYRIKHAQRLIESKPGLKVMEVAMMSGFNTVVSFNSAFKTYTGETPKEYMDRVRLRNRPGPSSRKESKQ